MGLNEQYPCLVLTNTDSFPLPLFFVGTYVKAASIIGGILRLRRSVIHSEIQLSAPFEQRTSRKNISLKSYMATVLGDTGVVFACAGKYADFFPFFLPIYATDCSFSCELPLMTGRRVASRAAFSNNPDCLRFPLANLTSSLEIQRRRTVEQVSQRGRVGHGIFD